MSLALTDPGERLCRGWRRIDYTLDVTGFEFTFYKELEADVASQGSSVKPYTELGSDLHRLTKLYALDCALWADVPFGETVTQRSLEQFLQEEILE